MSGSDQEKTHRTVERVAHESYGRQVAYFPARTKDFWRRRARRGRAERGFVQGAVCLARKARLKILRLGCSRQRATRSSISSVINEWCWPANLTSCSLPKLSGGHWKGPFQSDSSCSSSALTRRFMQPYTRFSCCKPFWASLLSASLRSPSFTQNRGTAPGRSETKNPVGRIRLEVHEDVNLP